MDADTKVLVHGLLIELIRAVRLLIKAGEKSLAEED
jgi:hypothetical protein